MDFPSFYCLTWDSFRPGVRPQLVRTRRSPTWPWAFAPVRSRRARPADPIATSLERKWRCSKHGGIFGDTFWIYLDIWLVVSNMFFQYIGNVIIPTDELHHFSEGLKPQPPTRWINRGLPLPWHCHVACSTWSMSWEIPWIYSKNGRCFRNRKEWFTLW